MPVIDHPIHSKTSFKEVPLSPCHSSLPDKSRQSYLVMGLRYTEMGVPFHSIEKVKRFHDNTCKQTSNDLPECRGCENYVHG